MNPPRNIAQYRVLKLLGEGSFGAVYMADGEIPGKGGREPKRGMVAIKQLHGDFNMRSFETLVNEYELLDRVNHRSLCKVYQFLDREMALVMECVNGQTLRTIMDATMRDPAWPDAVVEIGAELAEGLYRAWSAPTSSGRPLGMVHLDLKPENVMLTPAGEVRILDLGLARADEGPSREPAGGTPLYMAPEQARGEDVGHTSDLFSLGLILFELLMNRPAYMIPDVPRESRIQALMMDIERGELSGSVVALKRRWPKIGQVVARCLNADPDQRPVDGHHLMLALQECSSATRGGGAGDYARWLFEERVKVPDRRFRPTKAKKPGKVNNEGNTNMSNKPARPNKPGPKRPTNTVRPSTNSRPRANRPPTPSAKPSTGGDTWTPPAPAAPKLPSRPKGPENLRMVPLANPDGPAGLGDEDEIFVQLKRPDVVPDERPPSGAPPGMVVASQSGAPQAIGMTPMMGAPAAMGIQGPVANGPVAAAPGFSGMPPASMHGMQTNPGGAAPENRARSYRVYVAVLALISLVFSAAMVVVLAVAWAYYQSNVEVAKEEGVEKARPVERVQPSGKDTASGGAPAPVAPVAPVRERRPPRVVPKNIGTKPNPGPKTPKPPSKPKDEEPPPPPPGSKLPLVLQFSGPTGSFSGASVSCEDGTRAKAGLKNGKITFPALPMGGCKVAMRGGGASSFGARGGVTMKCSINGAGGVDCR